MPLEFKRPATNILATSSESGIMITAVWTVVIGRDKCVEYVENYNEDPDNGFVEFNEQVILIHDCARLVLTHEEKNAIIDMIKSLFMS